MKPKTRFTEIDFLRFLAAFAVVLLHYGIRGFADNDTVSPFRFPLLGPWSRYNYLAVNLFFMISGFVIFMSAQGAGLRSFLVSRCTRLYPAYWIACTLAFLVILVFLRDKVPTSFPRYLANMTMLNGFLNIGAIDGLYWTLFVEIKFYLMIAALLWLGIFSRIHIFLGLWLLIATINLALPNRYMNGFFAAEYSAYFVAGGTFYLIQRAGFSIYRCILLICSMVVGYFYDLNILLDKTTHYSLPFSSLTLGIILAAFWLAFLYIVTKKEKAGRLDAAFTYLGSLSYQCHKVSCRH